MPALKKVLQGYDILAATGRKGLVQKIKVAITVTPFLQVSENASKLIFGNAVAEAEIITRQYALRSFGDMSFNRELLACFATPEQPATLVLPPEWRKMIAAEGIKVDGLRSRIHWNYKLLQYLVFFSIILVKNTFTGIMQLLGIKPLPVKKVKNNRYVHFSWLVQNSYPQPDEQGVSHDIISWYLQWEGRQQEIDTVYHSVKEIPQTVFKNIPVSYLEDAILPLYTKAGTWKYICWTMPTLFSAVVSYLRGHWWNVLLLGEAIQAAKIRFQEPENIGLTYLFHNSGWHYRPMWTYEAEKQGAEILFYFYSTNCETIAYRLEDRKFFYGYQAMRWPHYLVWDEYQADFVRRAVGQHARISVVGPIWFSTSNISMPALPQNTIAVFDVQPYREGSYKTLAIEDDYYVPEVCNRFIADIYAVSKEMNLSIAFKRKRDIGKKMHPKYRNYIHSIASDDNLISIDVNTSAIKLIERSFMVISMPFTSTAILGIELKKPSVFYDPFGMIPKNDPAAHGIPIISGIEELRSWVSLNCKKLDKLFS